MVFKRFVEIGRVALVNYGPDSGKLCVIVDVLDETRALVDGASSGVKRQVLPFKRMSLTDYTVEITRSTRSGHVKKAFEKAEIAAKWEKSAWAKKLATRKARASLTDFDRFKVMVLRKKRSAILNQAAAKLRKEAK
eukprot:comp11901_c1_seq1/m.6548 comp11901_c1_seq1/g.6548  ORF comp11901_c1_seq1/g.6548 comp11901_c1_seq1/m.6548 type:complete len:136 (-) comp11901_c1_seq1:78-485(-)